MKDIRVSDSIMPLGEFKAKAATILKGLTEQDTPLVITQNGRPAAVLLSPVAFDELREKQRLVEAVIDGLADFVEERGKFRIHSTPRAPALSAAGSE